MKNGFKYNLNKRFKIIAFSLLLILVIIFVFHVPTRLVVQGVNRNSNLPVDLLARSSKVDWSAYEVEHGFGMRSYYATEPDGSMLRYDVSSWPDALMGKQRVDFVISTDSDYSVYGFSVGDALSEAEETLRKHGFIKTEDSGEKGFRCRKFGVIISCWADERTGKIIEISVRVSGTNILGIVY